MRAPREPKPSGCSFVFSALLPPPATLAVRSMWAVNRGLEPADLAQAARAAEPQPPQPPTLGRREARTERSSGPCLRTRGVIREPKGPFGEGKKTGTAGGWRRKGLPRSARPQADPLPGGDARACRVCGPSAGSGGSAGATSAPGPNVTVIGSASRQPRRLLSGRGAVAGVEPERITNYGPRWAEARGVGDPGPTLGLPPPRFPLSRGGH